MRAVLHHAPASTWEWPGNADVAVALTFDVDAESGLLGEGDGYARRLSSLSEGRFGVTRGVPRILELLRRYSVPATFFVPGHTADQHPETVEAILEGGHEVGHHGYLHLRSDHLSAADQRLEIERGLTALAAAGAPRPLGYRSASWELTPETFGLLVEHAFTYDSSCMGDDRPYVERYGPLSLLEIPVHWSLDDWPHFGWSIDNGGNVTGTDTLLRSWTAEHAHARAERRMVTYTMHPEVIGRGYRITALEQLLQYLTHSGSTWFARLADVAAHVQGRVGSAG